MELPDLDDHLFLVLSFSRNATGERSRRIFALGSHDNNRLIDVSVIKVSISAYTHDVNAKVRACLRVSDGQLAHLRKLATPELLFF
jgi:hypothetical protein